MANQYTLTDAFSAISETQGTLYNVGDSAIELASSASTAKGTGILLMTGERRTFNGTLYARSMDSAATLNVSDFTEAAGGGDQPVLRFCGTVSTYADLPASPEVGDVYNVETADAEHGILAGDNVAWNGTEWDRMAGVYAVMTGATASTAGAAGLVPAPTAGQEAHVLMGGGAWELPYGFREPSTAYTAGDLALCGTLASGLVLRCTTAGTTAATALDCSSASLGDTVTDGTVTWLVTKYVTLDANGGIPTNIYIPGAFNKKVTLTTSGTFTAPVTGVYRITLQGAGGGGGGAGTSYNGYHSGGGGGGQGAYYQFYAQLQAGTSYSYVIGAGGTGGTAGSASSGTGANGTDGGSTSITIGNDTFSADGGQKGQSSSNRFLAGHGGYPRKNNSVVNDGSYGASGTIGGFTETNTNIGGSGGGAGGGVSQATSYTGAMGGGGAGGAIVDNVYNAGNAGGNGFILFEYYDTNA